MLCARDVMFIRDLLTDLAIRVSTATRIYSDSKSAIDMSFDPVAFKKTKHILRAAEFLRDLVAREVITLVHLAGRVMIADLLTKGVPRPVFVELLAHIDAYASYRAAALPVDSAIPRPRCNPVVHMARWCGPVDACCVPCDVDADKAMPPPPPPAPQHSPPSAGSEEAGVEDASLSEATSSWASDVSTDDDVPDESWPVVAMSAHDVEPILEPGLGVARGRRLRGGAGAVMATPASPPSPPPAPPRLPAPPPAPAKRPPSSVPHRCECPGHGHLSRCDRLVYDDEALCDVCRPSSTSTTQSCWSACVPATTATSIISAIHGSNAACGALHRSDTSFFLLIPSCV